MVDLWGLLELEATMFLLILAGGWLKRKGTISEEGQTSLSNVLMNVILPCNILNSFLVSLEANVWRDFALVIVLCAGVMTAAVFGGKVFYRLAPESSRRIMQYATLNANVAFLGLPVCEGLFGQSGTLNATIYMIPQRLVVWSYGLFVLGSGERDQKRSGIKSLVLQPCMLAAEIGLVFMLFSLKMPSVLQLTISQLGKCLFPMSMLLIGAILSKTDLKTIVNRWTIYYSLIRLAVLPGLAFVLGLALGARGAALGVAVVMAGMPAAGITAILAGQFGLDQEFASKIVALSTLLSTVTIPIWGYVAQLV